MNNHVFFFITSVLALAVMPAVAPAVAPLVAPVVAPGAALYGGGAIGGGAIGGVGGFLHEKKVTKGECKKLRKEGRELNSRLRKLKTDLAAKQPDIDNVEKKLNVK